MRIKDSALGNYSIEVGMNKYIIFEGDKSVTTVTDFNDALREIAKRIVHSMNDVVTLGEFHRITEEVFDSIKRSYELIPLTDEEVAQHNNQ